MKNNRVIVDTSVLVGQIDGKDTWHRQAALLAETLVETNAELIYFDCVINETVSVLCRRLAERKGALTIHKTLALLQRQIKKENITWLYPATRKHYDRCLDLIKGSNGKINFHDALIALSAKDIGIGTIASFDKDFDDIAWLRRLEAPA